jgi:cytidylate kinase
MQEIGERVAQEARREREHRLGPFITISRQAAAGGREVARQLGEWLGCSVLDKELVQTIAEQQNVPPRFMELMDETKTNWLQDDLITLVDPRMMVQDSYAQRLGKIIILAAYDGPVVIVGRGAQYILPNQKGLHVRIVADRAVRLERLQAETGREGQAAEEQLDEIDSSRDEFVHRVFRRSVHDLSPYDLVIDSTRLGVEGAVRLIQTAYEVRGFA